MTFLYCNFGGNTGDRSCSPRLYFDEFKDELEFFPTTVAPYKKASPPLILGGGGLFCSGSNALVLNCLASGHPVIVWGAGTNLCPLTAPCDLPESLSRCALVGVRDYGQAYPYVPCASCLNPELNATATPQHDYMVFSHYAAPLNIPAPVSIVNNQADIRPVIRAILSARVVITNSYHGAFWGMLLGRRVLACNIRWNKFAFLKYQPAYCTEEDWSSKLAGDCPAPPDYLTECRDLNMDFYRKVKELLK